MDPIIIAIIIIVFVAIIIIGIVLFVVANKRKQTQKYKQIPADILTNIARIKEVQVFPKPFDPKSSKLAKKGSGENGDEYVNELYDIFTEFCKEQMLIDLNDKNADIMHKEELIKGNYNNVLDYLIRTEYSNIADYSTGETNPDPLERLTPMVEALGLHISKTPSYDDTDDYNYEWFGYGDDDITPPEFSIIYADLEEHKTTNSTYKTVIHDDKNLHVDIILDAREDGVYYRIDFADDNKKHYMQDELRKIIKFPIYLENQTNVIEVLQKIKDIWTGKLRDGE